MDSQQLLLIETSGPICSVALSKGDKVLINTEANAALSHAKLLGKMVQETLSGAGVSINQLDALAISSGPGSYTGLRIGYSLIKGMAMSAELPIIQIDTLHALVRQAIHEGIIADRFYAAIDARRMEAYTKIYDAKDSLVQGLEATIFDEERIFELNKLTEKCCFLGTANPKLRQHIVNPNIHFAKESLSASFLIHEANEKWKNKRFENIFSLIPTYLKPPNITTSKKTFFN